MKATSSIVDGPPLAIYSSSSQRHYHLPTEDPQLSGPVDGTVRLSNDLRLVDDSKSDEPLRERRPVPPTVEPTERNVLAARHAVIRFRQRRHRLLERLVQPAYINTDASCRNGLAGLAYESEALGTRTELVRCEDTVKAEHLALLMAMEDAEQVLTGRIEFRVDSTAVVTYAVDKSHRLRDIRQRTDELLERHPDWKLTLVKRKDNMRANALTRVPFKQSSESPAPCTATPRATQIEM